MPLVSGDDFVPKGPYRNGHYNTMIPHVFAKSPKVPYVRERLTLNDGDFLDIDYLRQGATKAMYLLHGLEGSSDSKYIRDFAKNYYDQGWDVIAINFRGCSGEMNLHFQMYNSGTTDDVHEVITRTSAHYTSIAITGYSLGANIALKYLGEEKHELPLNLTKCIAISAPVHLSDGSQQLLKSENYIYQLNFLRTLRAKVKAKNKDFPSLISTKNLKRTFNLYDFDQYFTAPMFGYADAEDYYALNQSIQWLHLIDTPTLIINAKDDPFLGPKSYPYDLVKELEDVFLCTPRYGGHVGFYRSLNDRSWIFEKVNDFLG